MERQNPRAESGQGMLGKIRLYDQHTFDSPRQILRGKQASLEIYVCRLLSNATLASCRHTDQIAGKALVVSSLNC